MAIKLLLLKSGEDIISEVSEMAVGEGEERRVFGYFLHRPCVVKMRRPEILDDQEEGNMQKAGYQVNLFPWMPLSKEQTIPVNADWVITLTNPIDSLRLMYTEDILNHGKQTNENSSTNQQSNSDQSD